MSGQQVVRFHTENEIVTALVVEGRKKLLAVVIGPPVRVLRLEKREQRFMTPLDYPVKRARKRLRAAGRRLGITKSARRLLRGDS